MIRALALCSILVLGLAACGKQGLIEIVGVWPMDGALAATADLGNSTFDGLGGDDVDTQQGLCLKDDGTACGPEPFYSHIAVVRIANGYSADANNPVYGLITLTGFSVALSSTDSGAPVLQGPAGLVNEVIRADEARNIVLPLVDPDAKRAYSRAAPNDHYRYSARYLLQFSNSTSLHVGTSVVLGPFSACASGSSPTSNCPTIFP